MVENKELQKILKKAPLLDRALMLVSVVCFLGAALLLYDDSILFSHDVTGEGLEELGTVVITENDVRRKIRDNFAWFKLKNETSVFNGDSIFTGPASRVTLRFKTGGELSLDENSLVVLKTATQDLNINLKYGEVSKIARQKGKVFLEHGEGESAEVSGSDAIYKISAQKGMPFEVKVMSGNVGFKDGRQGQVLNLTKNDAVKIAPNETSAPTQSYEIELVSPQQGDEVWFKSKSATVNFSWRASDEVKLYRLEMSRSKSFSEIIFEKNVTTKSLELPSFNERGKLYWRVWALESTGEGSTAKINPIGTSRIKYFIVREQKAPELIFPPSGSSLILAEKQLLTPAGDKFNFSDFLSLEKSGTQALKFTWNKKNYENVVFELSKDKGFSKDIIEKVELTANEILLEKIPTEGTYYWRIYGDDQDKGERLAAKPFEISIVKAIDLMLVKPENNTKRWMKAGKTDFIFQWSANDAIKYFEIEVSSSRDMSSPIIKKLVENKEFKLNDFTQKGDFFWRITGLDKQKTGDGFVYKKVVSSEVFNFFVGDNQAPQLVSPANGTTVVTSIARIFAPGEKIVAGGGVPFTAANGGVLFAWKNNGFSNTIIEVSKKIDFKEIEFSKLLSNEIEIAQFSDIADDKYFWRVRSDDQKSGRENQTSQVFNVQILKNIPVEPLQAPNTKNITKRIELEPIGNNSYQAVDLSGKGKPYLDWTPSKNATGYQVTLSTAPTMDKIVAEAKVSEPKFDWKEIKPGRYFWNVKAESDRMPSSVSGEPGQLIVTVAAPKVEPVKSVFEKVDSDEALNAPIPPFNLKWEPTQMTARYLVEVADNSEFKNAKKIKSKDEKIKFEVPKIGEYFWRVTSLDEADREVSSVSSTQSFQFNRKMGLKTPQIMSPAFDSSMVFLSKSASHVVLVWKKVNKADYYEFELSDDEKFTKPYFKQKSSSNKEYVQLELPNGKNYWRIRAVNKRFKSDWTNPIPFVVSYGAGP